MYQNMSESKHQKDVFTCSRNPYLAKWEILFDKKSVEWISFKPKLGLQVYPCYACRDMFGSRNSFLDHVNRRGMILKFKCNYCPRSKDLLFYNPCSFLLHTRQHYTLLEGKIDLDCLEVSQLPFGLAGFLPDPSVPLLYQVVDDNVGETNFINTRFYGPTCESVGQQIINLVSNELLFLFSQDATLPATSLILKQISSNIPRCRFVILDNTRFAPLPKYIEPQKEVQSLNSSDSEVKVQEDLHETSTLPVITKVESLNESNKENPNESNLLSYNENTSRCPECKKPQVIPMVEHFLKTEQPFQDSLKCVICKYIAPTYCSLQAHQRIHKCSPPYVCPECGKDFESIESFYSHMEEVCFHLTKQVRLRCPGKRCGKIFAQVGTFSSHFLLHMLCLIKCIPCDSVFYSANEYAKHKEMSDLTHFSVKLFKCTVCSDVNETFTKGNFQEHIFEHTTNKRQLLYVYICKRCHSYFRSTLTYATHILRCTKSSSQSVFQSDGTTALERKTKAIGLHVIGTCVVCKVQMKIEVHKYDNIPTNCSNCGSRFSYKKCVRKTQSELVFEPNKETSFINAHSVGKCLLCKEKMTYKDINDHFSEAKCKYGIARVFIEKPVISSVSSPSSDDSSVKQKKRKLNKRIRNQSVTANETDMTIEPDEVVPFNGTYKCKICNFINASREVFHNHIVKHRDIDTAYQCMECGECFVVKPSLVKHLVYFHQVIDSETYFIENNCFDKEAVKELESVMRLAPGESKKPVAKNQCRVCFLQFENVLKLEKHFRTHGMAFLLKNCK